MTAVAVPALAGHQFLRGMPARHLAYLAEVASLVTVPAHHRFFETGAVAQHFWLVRAGRSVRGIALTFVAVALLALVFDVLMLVRGRSMVLVVGAIFAAAAVLSLVPKLALGIPLAIVVVAAYVGVMLLVAFRKRAG